MSAINGAILNLFEQMWRFDIFRIRQVGNGVRDFYEAFVKG
jgi:hypothetical protein